MELANRTWRLERMSKPSIAMVNGFALGGGCELALACTLRTAADTARLGLPEVSLGIIPGYGGTQRLARIAGPGVAREWVLTGEMVGAEEAWRVGVINKVFPSKPRPYETVRSPVAKAIFERKVKQLIEDWSEKLKEAYETRIFVEGLGD